MVEILSKSSMHWDREEKRAFYQRFGVSEYWIVDPFQETVEVIDLTAGTPATVDPAASRVLAGFSVSWAELFADER
ncbi:MAG: Uma2 family endonuclease [Chloroflexota bacterium]